MAKQATEPTITDLGTNEGRKITGTGLIIRKTGDGLNEAMKIEPRVLHHGDHVYVVLECDVVDVHYPVEDRKSPKDGGVQRVHVLDAGTATFIDADVVRDAIEAQADKNQRWRDEQAGRGRLDDGLLILAHEDGKHAASIVEHCPLCDDELTKAAAGE